MRVEQIYTKCLAQGSYYIESNGEAVVIDPLRDVDKYISFANKSKSKIKYVLETHFHASFEMGVAFKWIILELLFLPSIYIRKGKTISKIRLILIFMLEKMVSD